MGCGGLLVAESGQQLTAEGRINFLSGTSAELPTYVIGAVDEAAALVAIHLASRKVLRTPTLDAPASFGAIKLYATFVPDDGDNPSGLVVEKLVGRSSDGGVVACAAVGEGATCGTQVDPYQARPSSEGLSSRTIEMLDLDVDTVRAVGSFVPEAGGSHKVFLAKNRNGESCLVAERAFGDSIASKAGGTYGGGCSPERLARTISGSRARLPGPGRTRYSRDFDRGRRWGLRPRRDGHPQRQERTPRFAHAGEGVSVHGRSVRRWRSAAPKFFVALDGRRVIGRAGLPR